MIDFHCHLDLYPQPEAVVNQIAQTGMYVLAVTTTPRSWQGNRRLALGVSRIQVAIGLHPELVASRHSEVELVCPLISETRYVGEIGLDGSLPHRKSFSLQQHVLKKILLACSDQGGRIMTLHSRCAATQVLDALEAHPDSGIPVLHWFSGTRAELRRAVEFGCWFSVGPAMLRSQKGREMVGMMPRERIITESDGPFVRVGAEPLMPWGVHEAEVGLSRIWGVSAVDVAGVLRDNFKRLVAVDVV